MLLRFIPQQFDFFEMFDRQVSHAVEAAVLFNKIVVAGVVDEDVLDKMQSIEHQGDEAAHIIIDQLNKIFITPFDREDIYDLTKELDDVIDMITTIVNRLHVYKLSGTNPNLVEFAKIIEKSVRAVECAVKGMRNSQQCKSITDSCIEINRLENVGDTMRDRMLAELFETEKNDPIAVIKWKEIYQDAETVLDICEDVAHVVESILVKQA